jgi:hypothetical protein
MQSANATKENLEKEHICCAISSNVNVQVSSKKNGYPAEWTKVLYF